MPPAVIGTVFAFFGLLALWALHRASRTGEISSEARRYRLDVNPIGFSLTFLADIGVVALCGAEVLHAMGLSGDPLAYMQDAFHSVFAPFLCDPAAPLRP